MKKYLFLVFGLLFAAGCVDDQIDPDIKLVDYSLSKIDEISSDTSGCFYQSPEDPNVIQGFSQPLEVLGQSSSIVRVPDCSIVGASYQVPWSFCSSWSGDVILRRIVFGWPSSQGQLEVCTNLQLPIIISNSEVDGAEKELARAIKRAFSRCLDICPNIDLQILHDTASSSTQIWIRIEDPEGDCMSYNENSLQLHFYAGCMWQLWFTDLDSGSPEWVGVPTMNTEPCE